MASVDVLDETWSFPEVGVVPVWAYIPPAESDESLKNAASVVACDPTKLRLDEDFKTFQIICLSSDHDGETTREEDIISFDFTKQQVDLKTKKVSIPSLSIKFIHSVPSVASMNKVMLFYQDEVNIQALHFVTLQGELQLLFIINAFRRLLFESYKPFSTCDKEAVAVVDNLSPSFVGEFRLSVKNKLEKKDSTEEPTDDVSYTVVMGVSCMCLYQHRFSCDPLYVLYFWDSPDNLVLERVIMYSNTDTVKLETKENSFEIHNANEQCPTFLNAIREMRPISKDVFTDPEKMVKYFSRKPSYSIHDASSRVPSIPTTSTLSDNTYTYNRNVDFDKYSGLRQQITTFQEDLNIAVSKFEDNEQIQMPWIVAESEINDLLATGFVPETDIASGGLDSDSMEHFLQCVREIEDHLTGQRYEMALSRLQGTRLIFSESTIAEMANLFKDDDIALMKKIYYHSFL